MCWFSALLCPCRKFARSATGTSASSKLPFLEDDLALANHVVEAMRGSVFFTDSDVTSTSTDIYDVDCVDEFTEL